MSDISLLYNALSEHGIPNPNTIASNTGFIRWGKNNRYWAIELNGNGYAFGDWTIPKDYHCVFDGKSTNVSLPERRAIMQKLREQHEKEQQLVQERKQKLSELATKLCVGHGDTPVEHPYLIKKQISCPADVTYDHRLKALLIPMYDIHGKIWSVQTIFSDGTKRFMPGARKKGCLYPFGDIASAGKLIVCEGFATAASIFEAVGIPTIAAFDAGNIYHVVHDLIFKYPTKEIIIGADNDWENQRNTGYETAKKVAMDYHIRAIVPQNLKTGMSDWNDISCYYGPNEIVNQFKKGDVL